MHGTHLQIHSPMLNQLIEQINTGAVDPTQAMPMLQAFYQHVSEHTQFASGDPALAGIVGQTKQILQITEEALNNTQKHMEKLQREQQAEPQAGGAPQIDPMQLKMQEHQMKMQIAQQKAELDFQIKQKKFDQEQGFRDAKAALEFQQ